MRFAVTFWEKPTNEYLLSSCPLLWFAESNYNVLKLQNGDI